MCSDNVAIEINGLSKCFHIYDRPQDRFKQFFLPALRTGLGLPAISYGREFWALNNVSLKIEKGETVGIIGRNGAGKSTLLQILCGTLNQSAGDVKVNGRVAALLELGAGFNPEFTGRENVYLNAGIMGLSREEVDTRFEEIAAFADIGAFIEQPVKTYSSGMYVRLAFAVQACVEPDILIVDEALAVGDVGFQYKCFKRMERLKAQGVTILMVTHSSGSILEHADRCVLMNDGAVVMDTDDVLSAVLAYEKGMLPRENLKEKEQVQEQRVAVSDCSVSSLMRLRDEGCNHQVGERRFGSARAIIDKVAVHRADGKSYSDDPILKSGEEVIFRFRILASEVIENVVLGVSMSLAQGADVWGDNNLRASAPITLHPGVQTFEYIVKLPLSSGDYLLHCGLACLVSGEREELDQRRPVMSVKFWSAREQVGVVFAPIRVNGVLS